MGTERLGARGRGLGSGKKKGRKDDGIKGRGGKNRRGERKKKVKEGGEERREKGGKRRK